MAILNETRVNDIDVPLDPVAFASRFGPDWWDEFLGGTAQMSTPEAFAQRMTRTQTARMRRLILDIIAHHAAGCRAAYGYRVWLAGAQLQDLDDHFARPPLPGEDIGDWTHRAFGDQPFGIILNCGEKFNDELSRAMAFALQPLLAKMGMPTEGFLFTIFIGNYDMTPLGIHKDLPGKSVMHFHLGPGPKTMYVWEDDRYRTEPGVKRQNNKNFTPHLPTAIARTFHEGDIYFMPENRFHLGMQDSLSIGIACWANNRSKRHFAERLMQLVRQNYLRNSDDMLKSDKLAPDDISGVEETLALYEAPHDHDLKRLLRHVYKDFRYALFSNAGLRNAPLPDDPVPAIADNAVVRIEEPYRIYHAPESEEGRLALYVRGIKLSLKDIGGLRALVDALNGGHAFSFEAVLDILGEPWTPDTGRYLLGLLRRHRGVRIC
jgi:hypothetical protein